MDDYNQQIDYNGLLMNHLNRLSYISTSSFIDAINNKIANEYLDPPSTGERALEWGSHFLLTIVPDNLVDEQFKKDQEEYLKIENKVAQDFDKLKAIVNLLNRKGLLLSAQLPASNGFKKKPEVDFFES